MSITSIYYSTNTFHDIYSSQDKFLSDYGSLGLPKTISDTNCGILYYLLMGRYANSPIANDDETQFKLKVQATIWQYGPAWEKRLDMQDTIRGLSLADLQKGIIIDRTGSQTNTGTDTNSGSNSVVTSGGDTTTNTRTGNVGVSGNTSGSNVKTGSVDESGTETPGVTTTKSANNTHALNPGQLDTTTDLNYIDSQNKQTESTSYTGSNGSSGSTTYNNVTDTQSGTNSSTTTYNSLQDQQVTSLGSTSTTNMGTSVAHNANANTTGKEIHTKGVLDAYAELWELLDNDVTNDFLAKFQKLFKQFARPETMFPYVTEEDED